jgi:hypothetical protein
MGIPVNQPTAWDLAGYSTCVKVTIPGNAEARSYPNAGWTFCKDAQWTQGCQTLGYDLVIEAAPTSELNPPATIPPLPDWYDNPATHCRGMSNEYDFSDKTCSMKNDAIGPADTRVRNVAYYCNLDNPDLGLELNTPPQYIDLISQPSDATSVNPGIVGFFYDAPRTYYSLARWFNEPKLENCARASASRYSKKGPGVPGMPPNWTAAMRYDQNGQHTSPTLGSYRCPPNDTGGANLGCYVSVHGSAAPHNIITKGIEFGLSRFNEGNYSSTWVPSTWQPAMRSEIHNLAWRFAGGWTPSGYGMTGGYWPPAGRETGYLQQVIASQVRSGEPTTQTTGTAAPYGGTRVTSLTQVGKTYENELAALLSDVSMWGTPLGTKTATNHNWGRAASQVYMEVIVMDGLMDAWEKTHDPAIPATIKPVLDILAPKYDTSFHAIPNFTVGAGPFCAGTSDVPPESLWYHNPYLMVGYCNGVGPGIYKVMSGMFALPFAWYWKNWGGSDNRFHDLAVEMLRASVVYSVESDPRPGAGGHRQSAKNYNENGRYWVQILRNLMGY